MTRVLYEVGDKRSCACCWGPSRSPLIIDVTPEWAFGMLFTSKTVSPFSQSTYLL